LIDELMMRSLVTLACGIGGIICSATLGHTGGHLVGVRMPG